MLTALEVLSSNGTQQAGRWLLYCVTSTKEGGSEKSRDSKDRLRSHGSL